MGFLHSPGYNHKVISLVHLIWAPGIHVQTHKLHTHTKTTLKKVPFVCSTLMKSYPLRTSITFENELETCCNPTASLSLSVSPAEWREGGENSQRPSSVWCVAPNETRRYQEPLLCWIYVWHWHNEAIWLWILHCMSINPQMPNTQTKKSCIFLMVFMVNDNTHYHEKW